MLIFKYFFRQSGVIQILEIYREPSITLKTPFINSIIDAERSRILADVMLYSEDENSELGLEDNWESIDMSDDDEKVEEENLQDGFQTIDTSNDEDDDEDEEEVATDQIEEAKDEEIDDQVIDEASKLEKSDEESEEKSDEESEEKSDE